MQSVVLSRSIIPKGVFQFNAHSKNASGRLLQLMFFTKTVLHFCCLGRRGWIRIATFIFRNDTRSDLHPQLFLIFAGLY